MDTSLSAKVLVRFYTREGCHLCEQALDTVEYLRERMPFRLEIRSIDAEPSWKARYGGLIPVLCVGRKQAHYRINPQELRSMIEAAIQAECWDPEEETETSV